MGGGGGGGGDDAKIGCGKTVISSLISGIGL